MAEAIKCPNCGCEIPLSDAFEHQVAEELQERLAGETERWEAERAKAVEAREAQLRAEFIASQVVRDKEVAERAEANVADELHELEERLAAQEETIKVARSQELEFRKAQRKLDDERAGMELEIARRLDDERGRLVDQATERLVEEHRLKLGERDATLAQMKAQIDDLKRAADPTRAGLQGEALERHIEDLLREHFPEDEISPVKAGARGADIVQRVRHPRGRDCGSILWESKRAANWSNGWIAKVKEDQKAAKADIAAIVSTVLPPA